MSDSSANKRIWTIIDLVNWGASYLAEKGFNDARLTIELLLAHLLKLKRIQLYTNFDRPLDETELSQFKELLKRRLSHEPVQYILGETEFMGLKFQVNRDVLIPRPDTEILVESTLNLLRQQFPDASSLNIFEIGTGSGCIAVSLASFLTTATVTAIDIDERALTMAIRNATANGVGERIVFQTADFLSEMTAEKKVHCIVSNPPYISTKEYALLSAEVKDFEPPSALTDGDDGLKFFRAIAARCGDSLVDNGFVVVEHAFDQSEAVRQVFTGHGWKNIATVKDYNGQFRCVVAHKP